jgi:ribosomal protein S18 acetylase RimI-like enzyme
VDDLRLRAMTGTEFAGYLARLIPAYADDHVRAGNYPADQAQELATKETADLLPQGAATPGHLFFTAETSAGEPVGVLWLNLGHRGASQRAWIYDIEIEADQRGRGYGRALLNAAERECAARGITEIALNVFSPNAPARSLYESSGYQVTTLQMRKYLAGS